MMINKGNIVLLPFVVLMIAACATGPKYDTGEIDLKLTPPGVVEAGMPEGVPLLWGGMIISSTNLKRVTRFEILAYPLDSSQKPQTDKKPLGRFLAEQDGYLEIRDYDQGRLITIKGVLQDTLTGKIGESEYTYPLVNIDDHYLWPERGDMVEPRVRFGIGVFISD